MSGYRYRINARAYCYTCGWENDAANAHGSGAQHARKHGHHVNIEVEASYTYNAPPKEKK